MTLRTGRGRIYISLGDGITHPFPNNIFLLEDKYHFMYNKSGGKAFIVETNKRHGDC